MRYSFEMPSPQYEILLSSLRSACVHMAAYGASIQVRYGRTSVQHRKVQAELAHINSIIDILEEAKNSAVPERAVAPPGVTDSPARNISDDMHFVAGRPRNDPRTPKKVLR